MCVLVCVCVWGGEGCCYSCYCVTVGAQCVGPMEILWLLEMTACHHCLSPDPLVGQISVVSLSDLVKSGCQASKAGAGHLLCPGPPGIYNIIHFLSLP